MTPNNTSPVRAWTHPEESRLEQAVAERDEAQEAVAQLYFIVFGRAAEWSNIYGIEQAVEDITDAVNLLKQVAGENQKNFVEPLGQPGALK